MCPLKLKTLSLLRKTKGILVIFTVFLSCENNRQLNRDTSTIEYYPDGHIKSIHVQKLNKDLEISLSFDSSGTLRKYENFKSDSPYNQLLFFSDGNLMQKLSMKRGQFDGTCLTFYNSGNIETVRYLRKGKESLDGIDYYDTAFLRAKSAVYFNEDGNVFYKEYFDLEGKLLKKEGNVPSSHEKK